MRCHRVLAIGLTIALTGCAHDRIIVRDCVTKEQYEELKSQEPPKVKDKLTGDADKDIRPITGSNLLLRQWGYNLLDTIRVCAGQ